MLHLVVRYEREWAINSTHARTPKSDWEGAPGMPGTQFSPAGVRNSIFAWSLTFKYQELREQ